MTPASPTPAYALAIHTSSPDLGFAIDNFAGDARQQVWTLGRDLSNLLHSYLLEFLHSQTWQDLAFLAVAQGPGGFTGTRMGVVTARTIAQQLNLPLFGISSLAAIAQEQGIEERAIAIQMPAQRGELFTAIYQTSATELLTLQPDTVMSVDQWQTILSHWRSPYDLIEAESHQGARATSVLRLAYQQWQKGDRPHWSETLPFYGQHPVSN